MSHCEVMISYITSDHTVKQYINDLILICAHCMFVSAILREFNVLETLCVEQARHVVFLLLICTYKELSSIISRPGCIVEELRNCIDDVKIRMDLLLRLLQDEEFQRRAAVVIQQTHFLVINLLSSA